MADAYQYMQRINNVAGVMDERICQLRNLLALAATRDLFNDPDQSDIETQIIALEAGSAAVMAATVSLANFVQIGNQV